MTARVASTPFARKLARQAGVALAQVRGSGPGGRVVAADLAAGARSVGATHASPSPGAMAPGTGDGCAATGAARVPSTPYARRLARARRIDLARLRGSGPNGRIVARDVERGAILTIDIATDPPAALCAHLNRSLAKDTPPIAVADVVTKAAGRVLGGAVAWTIDGIRPAWGVADAARQGLAAIARARMAGAAPGMPDAPLLRAVASRGRLALTITFSPYEDRGDPAALAARIRDTVAWPLALLL
jgi:pyruvate/2-oxoglutarate dehydrogenase complex dihydrolipoamide acyltransferase (E2) component